MAVFIAGTTTCPVRCRVIRTDEDVINFQPLFLSHHHAVFEVTGAVVHTTCLDRGVGANAVTRSKRARPVRLTSRRGPRDKKGCQSVRNVHQPPPNGAGVGSDRR
jgi:hypothetical protein